MVLLLQKALFDISTDEIYDVTVMRSLDNGYLCKLIRRNAEDNKVEEIVPTDEIIAEIDKRMHDLVKRDLPIEKVVMKNKQARQIFSEKNMHEKDTLLKYRSYLDA